jgi:putative DNA primase/helicase
LPSIEESRQDIFEFKSNNGTPLEWHKFINGGIGKTEIDSIKLKPFELNQIHSINYGERNNSLFNIACNLRDERKGFAEVLESISSINLTKCNPPLPPDEVNTIVCSAMRYPLLTTSNGNKSFDKITQLLIANSVAQTMNGKLHHVRGAGIWYMFDESKSTWATISESKINDLIIQDLRSRKLQFTNLINQTSGDYAKYILEIERCENSGFIDGTRKLLRSISNIEANVSDFDSNPMYVGLSSGFYIDLNTTTAYEITPAKLITKSLNAICDQNAKCPLWEKSVNEWCKSDKELISFLQTWCGYSLSGLTDFQKFLFIYGEGRNGKSVFINTILNLLHDYGTSINSNTLMLRSNNGGASGDIARLDKVRLATSIELPEGKVFDENLLKQLTGGDVITARHLYQSEFNFKPQLKLMICGNHKPIVKGFDEGIWRRILLVPFTAHIETADLELQSKLNAELPGILNWCLQGWKNYQINGMQVPQTVIDESKEYRNEMDLISQWIDDCLIKSSDSKTKASDLYKSYQNWSISNGFTSPMNSNAFGRRIKKSLGEPSRGSSGNLYVGVQVKVF